MLITVFLFHFSPLVADAENGNVLDESVDEADKGESEKVNKDESEEQTEQDSFKEDKKGEETDENPEGLDEEDIESTQVEIEVVEEPEEVDQNDKSKTKTAPQGGPDEFKLGDRDKQIIELKRKLNRLGFSGILETDYFGDFTERRVKEFQKHFGLKVTGIADKSTINMLDRISNSPLQKGKYSDALIALKQKMNHIGYGKITVTTFYGDFTERQVKAFQKDYNLPISGIIDDQTNSEIDDVFTSIYREGGRHGNIKDLKRSLNSIGFGGIAVTDYYGSFTTKRVKEFQSYYGLAVTGNANLETLNKIEKILSSTFKEGDRHEDIIELKNKLNKLGFGPITVTNLYGDFTAKKVKDFQKYYGLAVTGMADDVTLSKVEEVISSPLQKGKRSEDLIAIKQKMNHLGYGKIAVTTLFGDFTERQVKEFQKDNTLPISGIIEDNTKDKINNTFTSTYKQGSRHSSIKELKRSLNSIGFGGITVTDYYGSFTTKRVKEFQDYYDLPVTGNANLETLNKLESILSSPLQEGQRHKDTITLKNNLNKLGFGKITVTNLYGPFTVKKVKEFQDYYGLKVNGLADERTLSMIQDVLDSPFQENKRHEDTIQLKENLNKLGFGKISVTTLYGSFTTQKVTEFQSHYGLKAHGIADKPTIEKIDDILSSPFQLGKRNSKIEKIKRDLNKLGFSGITVTNYYGDFTEKRVKEFQKEYGLPVSGIVDDITLAEIDKAIKAHNAREIITYTNYNLTLKQAIDKQMNRSPQTDKYRNEPAYISAGYVEITSSGARTTTAVNIRSQANASSHIYATVPKGTIVNITQQGSSWHTISFGSWRNPTRSDVQAYVDPDKNDKYQHLLLTSSVGVKASELNKTLVGKGKLSGEGQAFIDGAKKYSVNEAYLISHAILETGHGSSTLAKGVKVNGVTVYNMFGIGAYDSCPVQCGSQHAYDQGWTTPYKAIVGGAEFIGRDYVHNQYEQNTLYKMRWNHVYAPKQYATDIGWAVKQVSQIKSIYEQLDNPFLHFDKPKFK